jgi:S1-C subfamily serine protease
VKVMRRGGEKIFDVEVAERKLEDQEETRGTFSFEEQKEEDIKPEIGLEFENVPANMAEYLPTPGGAIVIAVKPGSIAEEAGIAGRDQGGADIITEANGQKISDARDLLNIVRSTKSGESVVLKFTRLQRAGNRVQPATFYTSITKP